MFRCLKQKLDRNSSILHMEFKTKLMALKNMIAKPTQMK